MTEAVCRRIGRSRQTVTARSDATRPRACSGGVPMSPLVLAATRVSMSHCRQQPET